MLLDPAKPKRCAVYTRKSSEEGLDQQFNSLHAQREACEAYIASQKHEGWLLVPTEYDDGGFSGGTMQRPGLQKLLADIQAGVVDVVVTYKVDRLTRSLSDFAKIVDVLDAAGASFVSVTQAFNTTTSMGRLTLNVLLSFAQFEREVTGERIRDKLAASKAKGMWMGGQPPLGYDAVDKSLVINPTEAANVQKLFDLYRHLKSADAVVAEAYEIGIRSKLRVNRGGVTNGGGKILRGALYAILVNPIYVGEIPHKERRYPGLHHPIVDRSIFDEVQALIAKNRRKHALRAKAEHPALLSGLVHDRAGRKLISTHTSKGTRRYRYYAAVPGSGEPLRVPAKDLEQLVLDAVLERLGSAEAMAADVLAAGEEQNLTKVLDRAASAAASLTALKGSKLREKVLGLVDAVTVGSASIETAIRMDMLVGGSPYLICIVTPSAIVRQKTSLALVLPGKPQLLPDPALITCIAQARTWFGELASGKVKSLRAIGERDGVTPSYVSKLLDLAFLAPDLVTMIMEGRQPSSLTAAKLRSFCPLPVSFSEQRALLAAA